MPCVEVVQNSLEDSTPRSLQDKKGTTMEEGGKTLAPSSIAEPGNQSLATILPEERCNSEKMTPFPAEVDGTGALNLNVPVSESQGKRKVTDHSNVALCDSIMVPDDSKESCKKQKKISYEDIVTVISDDNSDLNMDEGDENSQVINSASLNDSVTHTKNRTLYSDSTSHDDHNIGDEPNDFIKETELKQSSDSMEGQVEGMLSLAVWKPLEKELYLKGLEMFGRNRYGLFLFSTPLSIKSCFGVTTVGIFLVANFFYFCRIHFQIVCIL